MYLYTKCVSISDTDSFECNSGIAIVHHTLRVNLRDRSLLRQETYIRNPAGSCGYFSLPQCDVYIELRVPFSVPCN